MQWFEGLSRIAAGSSRLPLPIKQVTGMEQRSQFGKASERLETLLCRDRHRLRNVRQAGRRPNMMMNIPSRLTPTPSQSVPVGLTLSTTMSQTMATPIYTPPYAA